MGLLDRLARPFRRRSTPQLESGSGSGSAVDEGVLRYDSWTSALGSWGTSKDKREYTNAYFRPIHETQAEILWRSNAIGSRIVELPANETLRAGFELKMDDKDLSEEVMAIVEDLEVIPKFLTAMHYERAYGGAAIWPVINDGNPNLSEPINLDRIPEVSHLLVFDTRELKPTRYYNDIKDKKLGEPSVFQVMPRHRGPGTAMIDAMSEIHESRLIVFPGNRVSRAQISHNGWGDSVFCRVFETLRDYGVGWAATSVLLQEFSQATMKINGLAKLLARDKDKVIQDRIKAVELARSTINMVLMDASEDYKREQTPVTGLREILDGFAQRVAADADMPVTLLMGMSPSGLNATGESDIRFFYDRVDVKRQLHVRPRLEQAIRFILRAKNSPTKGKEPDVWSVQFNPLWQPTEKEIADTRKTVADTDNLYVQMQAVTPEEVAVSRFGGDTYSMEMVIEHDVDADMNGEDAEASVEGVEPEAASADAGGDEIQKTALNGAQITSLVAVIQQVNENIISRESGVAVLMVAFQMSKDEAIAVIGEPPEKPDVPEAPPPPTGGFPPPPNAPDENEPTEKRADRSSGMSSSRRTRKRQSGRGFVVKTDAGRWRAITNGGDLLGEHATEKDALAQLRAGSEVRLGGSIDIGDFQIIRRRGGPWVILDRDTGNTIGEFETEQDMHGFIRDVTKRTDAAWEEQDRDDFGRWGSGAAVSSRLEELRSSASSASGEEREAINKKIATIETARANAQAARERREAASGVSQEAAVEQAEKWADEADDYSDEEKAAIKSIVAGTAGSVNEETWSPPPPPGMSQAKLEAESEAILAEAEGSQLEALEEYTGDSTMINSHLRGRDLTEALGYTPDDDEMDELRGQIDALDDLFEETSLSEPVIVYRGTSLRSLERQGVSLTPGTVFEDPAYMSTSTDQSVIESFAEGSENVALMEIAVPKGTQGIYVESITENPDEFELLLNRGHSLRIISVIEEPSGKSLYGKPQMRRRIKAEVVPRV
jgi:hypothetical protein